MKLEVGERILLLDMLPREGDFTTLKLVRKLRETLSFSEKEIADIEFQNHWRCPKCHATELSPNQIKCAECGVYMNPAGAVTWDEGKAKNVLKDVYMGRAMQGLCHDVLKRKSDEGQLKDMHISLYEKFVEPDKED